MNVKKLGGSEVFAVITILIMGLGLFQARKFPFLAAIYPIFVCSVTIAACIALLVKKLVGKGSTLGGVIDIEIDSSVPASARMKKASKGVVWFLGLYLLTALLGFKLAALVFMLSVVGFEARARWYLNLALTSGLLAALIAFQRILNVFWPAGALGHWLAEPFPWLF